MTQRARDALTLGVTLEARLLQRPAGITHTQMLLELCLAVEQLLGDKDLPVCEADVAELQVQLVFDDARQLLHVLDMQLRDVRDCGQLWMCQATAGVDYLAVIRIVEEGVEGWQEVVPPRRRTFWVLGNLLNGHWSCCSSAHSPARAVRLCNYECTELYVL